MNERILLQTRISRPQRTKIHEQGRVIGHVSHGRFIKNVSASRHMLRKPPAWAFGLNSLMEAEAAGAWIIELRDKDSGKVYRASLKAVRQYGFEIRRGYEVQLALTLRHWQRGKEFFEQLPLI